ncbi:cysteine desulfurase family protein [Planctomicrobium sp. SH527]|uniref:cysteine desulfurase family protein n=1 Tax=Planctomicrobium sp. SH527 TaxID=3448123 RepID=UPI003F5B1158
MLYLDNNATTPIDPEALEAMVRVAGRAWGNPGSRHLAGRRARQALEDARESIAEILNAAPQEVVFTSGGTESNNFAISGLAHSSFNGLPTGESRTGTILLPPGEHPATDEPIQRLVSLGWKRIELELNESGRIQSDIESIPLDDVRFATALLAHNETGVIQHLRPLIQRCSKQGIPFHVDAVQAAGKIDVDFRALGATTMSVGAHKFHGPRGIGALLIRQGVEFPTLLLGGHQEAGRRAGTEPVMLAVGMNTALRNWHTNRVERVERISRLRDRLEAGLIQSCPPVFVNGDTSHRLPNTANLSFPGVEGDPLMIALDIAGVCCSLGSACASGSLMPSPVLVGMGLSADRYSSALRLSVSHLNTEEEIDSAIQIISQTVTRLRS